VKTKNADCTAKPTRGFIASKAQRGNREATNELGIG